MEVIWSGRLHCMASETGVSCSHLQCKGSDLFIGDTCVNHTANGCNLRACVYRGHYGSKIFRRYSIRILFHSFFYFLLTKLRCIYIYFTFYSCSLVNFSNVQCPGMNVNFLSANRLTFLMNYIKFYLLI